MGSRGKPEPKTTINPFIDVPNNAWYLKPVLWAVEQGITGGTSPTTFSPDAECTRAQIVTFLYAAAGKPSISGSSEFADVANADWYAKPVIWAKENDITGGTGPNTFGPLNVCTRGQVVTFLFKAYGSNVPEVTPTPTPTPTPPATLNAEQIYAKCAPAVFYIELYNKSGQAIGSGSGVFLNADGLAITNHHVVEDAYSAKIKTYDGKVYNVSGYYDAKETIDLALIQIDGSGFSCMELGSTNAIAGGQSIFTIGSPKGFANTISSGIVSNPNVEFFGIDSIQISAPISHGSSGGALINDKGQLIGITFAGLDEAQNVNFAIPIHRMQELSTGTLKNFPLGGNPPVYTGVSLQFEPSLTLEQGSTVTLPITVNPGNCPLDKTGIYHTIDDKIFIGEWGDYANGQVALHITGVAVGTTTVVISLELDDGTILIEKPLTITVTEPAPKDYGASLTAPSTLAVRQGRTFPLEITAFEGNYPYPDEVSVYYEIANESIATAQWGDWDGDCIDLYVYGKAPGTTTATIYLLGVDDTILSTADVTIIIGDYSAPQGQQAFEAMRDWIIANHNDMIDNTYIYSEQFEDDKRWFACDLMYTPGDDYIDISVWVEQGTTAIGTRIDLDPNFDIGFLEMEYYGIEGKEYKYYFSGYAEVNKSSFNVDSSFRFKEAGYVPPYSSANETDFMVVAKYNALQGLSFADSIFFTYLPQYSVVDFGYTNIYN